MYERRIWRAHRGVCAHPAPMGFKTGNALVGVTYTHALGDSTRCLATGYAIGTVNLSDDRLRPPLRG